MMSGKVQAQQQQYDQQCMIDSATSSNSRYGLQLNHEDEQNKSSSSRLLRNITQTEQQTNVVVADEGNSKHSVVSSFQSGDDNSTGSWSVNSLNGAASNQSGGLRRTAGDRRLSVVLPSIQKSLVTPTVIAHDSGATPTQLFSSLIQLNGQEVGLFTGLPSCTPTSADGLACAGINPFFWGVAPFNHTQKSPTGMTVEQQLSNDLNASYQQHIQQQQANIQYTTNAATTNGEPQSINGSQSPSTKAAAGEKERRRQLSKLSIDQLQAANVILTSPLSFLLSPEHETWFRLGLQNHPLSSASKNGGQQPAAGCYPITNLKHNPAQTTDLMPPTSQVGSYATRLEHPTDPHLMASYANHHHKRAQAAQDLTSNQLQQVAHHHRLGSISDQSSGQVTYLQQQQPSIISSQYSSCNLPAATETGYNNSVQQLSTTEPAGSAVAQISTSSSSNTNTQQQSTSTRSPNFNSPQLNYQQSNQVGEETQQQQHSQYAQTDTAPHQSVVVSSGNRRAPCLTQVERRNEREAHLMSQDPLMARVVHDSMAPPMAHHHQLPAQHQGASFLVMGPHQFDPRFAEFHHHQQLSGIHYDPHFHQLYLAQQQQEIYNLQQHHQQQQNQQHHNPAFQQQDPTYQQQIIIQPADLQEQQTQQHLTTKQPSPPPPPTSYQVKVSETITGENSIKNPTPSGEENHSNNTTNYMDTSSSNSSSSSSSNSFSNSNGSNSVSPHPQTLNPSEHSNNKSSSSTTSSVSRDTNSVDVIASTGLRSSTGDRLTVPANEVPQLGGTKLKTPGNRSKQVSNKQTVSKKADDKSERIVGSTNNGDQVLVVKKKSKGGRKKKVVTHEEMMARKNRSKERNRVAAKRCRQKRKQFLDELRGRIDNLNDSNKKLSRENNQLKSELERLKNHHKICTL